MIITVFDTSVCSSNLGDFIIMDAVREQIYSIFPTAMLLTSITHEKISWPTYALAKASNYNIIGGTNLLSSNMNSYNQWKINLFDSIFLDDVVLMGVGWWQYQNKPNYYTKILLQRLLHKDVLHSVRDAYTKRMLETIGLSNVLNTSCPTMWGLTKEHCSQIPTNKADAVVFTLTDYNKSHQHDADLINLLLRNYADVYFWPQGIRDLEYLKELTPDDKIRIMSPALKAFNELLMTYSDPLDYVGTRLHAGIRSLQHKRRTIIVGIDNRASEKERDFDLLVCQRGDLNRLKRLIQSVLETRISIPEAEIKSWTNQFLTCSIMS